MGEDAGIRASARCFVKRWRDLESWITAGDLASYSSQFPLAQLHSLLSPRTELVEPGNSFGEAQPISLHLTGGISIRKRVSPYKGRVFVAYPGDIVVSKIDARNGAIGVVPQAIKKAAVTSEFPVFTPKTDLVEPDFIRYVVRTGSFLESLRIQSSGTSGRKRISPDAFLDLLVPLPDLVEQQRILKHYHDMCSQADQLLAEATDIELRAFQRFETTLGLASAESVGEEYFEVTRFSQLDRWSHDWIVQSRTVSRSSNLNVRVVELDSTGDIQYGLAKSPGNRPLNSPRPYLRVANVQRWHLDLDTVKYIEVPDDELEQLRLLRDDVLVCEGGSIEQVGRAALWGGEIDDCVHQNHILRVRVDPSVVLPIYLVSVLNSGYGQRYFRLRAKRTTNLASINRSDLAGFPLPLPSVEVQEALTSDLRAEQEKVAGAVRRSAELRSAAWEGFVASVYTDTPPP